MTRPLPAKICRRCGRRGKVTDSRVVPSLGAQRRHHVCPCGHDWNTYETSLHPSLIQQVLESCGLAQPIGRTTVTINTPGRTVVRKP